MSFQSVSTNYKHKQVILPEYSLEKGTGVKKYGAGGTAAVSRDRGFLGERG